MGTHLIVLGKSLTMNTNMTGFNVIVKYFCDIAPWTKADSASQGLSIHQFLYPGDLWMSTIHSKNET